ncbi:class I SAM-dependent methyltransferase [Wolbachia endosymbiont of Pentidionis agamae]|uniref:class I SAM-dependent methyltransferase n=1 Tax=Wolbachia endosymbiont of Pentidionis agamae TaxID=3110435 RepID=UPI002FD72DA6
MLGYINKLIDENNGSISISEFMKTALYHKNYGYYNSKNPIGQVGDFITSPEISQLFGEILAVWIMLAWEKLGKPREFILVEFGPGKGTLMQDIMRVTKKHQDFYNAMSIHLIEISPILIELQKQALKNFNITWHISINTLPEKIAIFVANEFFDAMPIDQFVYYNGELYEVRVAKDLSMIHIKTKAVNVISIEERLFDGATIEMCSVGIDLMKKIEEYLCKNSGSALIIDYGYINPPFKNTLQSIKNHRYSNILENIGESDITALVNFKALQDTLKCLDSNLLTQREFLYLYGIKERIQALMKNIDNEKQKKKLLSEYLRLTENMGTLFKVLSINSYYIS